jgi:hypothetical protein
MARLYKITNATRALSTRDIKKLSELGNTALPCSLYLRRSMVENRRKGTRKYENLPIFLWSLTFFDRMR